MFYISGAIRNESSWRWPINNRTNWKIVLLMNYFLVCNRTLRKKMSTIRADLHRQRSNRIYLKINIHYCYVIKNVRLQIFLWVLVYLCLRVCVNFLSLFQSWFEIFEFVVQSPFHISCNFLTTYFWGLMWFLFSSLCKMLLFIWYYFFQKNQYIMNVYLICP